MIAAVTEVVAAHVRESAVANRGKRRCDGDDRGGSGGSHGSGGDSGGDGGGAGGVSLSIRGRKGRPPTCVYFYVNVRIKKRRPGVPCRGGNLGCGSRISQHDLRADAKRNNRG